jgi:hypothetical protein
MVRQVRTVPPSQGLTPRPFRRRTAVGQRIGGASTIKVLALAGGPLLLIGLLTWPMLFTNQGYAGEWINHLWFIWDQSLSIRENYYPSYFLVTYHHSIFYPEFAFYGGTLNTLVGALSLALGDAPIVAYVAAYLFGFAASYGGWYWMARMAGLGRWSAHAPGIVFITSAYYLTLIYERGDFAEFIAISTIPLMMAAALSILRSKQLSLGPALALCASSIIFGGSHPLTLLWGSSLITLTCVLALLFIKEARQLVTWPGVLRVAALFMLAMLVSAWSLLPAIAYEAHTRIYTGYSAWILTLREFQFLVATGRIFSLSRSLVKQEAWELPLELPILAMAWSLVSVIAFLRKGLPGPWGRLLLVCAAMATLITVMMTHVGIIIALPRAYGLMQFSYRLESYVILATSGAVLAGLALARRSQTRARYWAWAVVPVLTIGVVGAIQQVGAYPAYGDRRQAIEQHLQPGPREPALLLDYEDMALPVSSAKEPGVDFPVASVHHDQVSMIVHLRPGERVYSNIGAAPELVHVTGAKVVGRAYGNDVLEIGPSIAQPRGAAAGGKSPRWTEVISVTTASGPPFVIGRILTLGALFLLAGGLALLITRRIRARMGQAR